MSSASDHDTPPSAATNADVVADMRLRGGRILLQILSVTLVSVALLATGVRWWLQGIPATWVTVVTVVVGCGLLWLLQTHRVRAAAWLYVAGLFPIVIFSTLAGAGPMGAAWVGMPIAAMVAGWLLGARTALLVCVAALAALWGVFALSATGYRFAMVPPVISTITYSFATVMGAMIGYFTSHSFGQQLKEVLSLSKALRSANEELEARVALRTRELSDTLDNLKKTQASLMEHEKLASLGSMVAGISHELNTPLGNILTVATSQQHHLESLQVGIAQGTLRRSQVDALLAELAESSRLIESAAQKATELVGNFKQVARDQTSEQRRQFDLLEVLRAHLGSVEPLLRKLQTDVDLALDHPIVCDSYPGPLGHLLTNVVLNAAIHGYQERGGTVTIRGHVEGETVVLTIMDQGVGMDAATAARVFDPFFTTRLGQGGSGLGLSMAKRIATGILGGDLMVRSAPGQGSEFVLEMPMKAPGAHLNDPASVFAAFSDSVRDDPQ